MSIEDVAYLKLHSVEDGTNFFCDSRSRDKGAYPFPSEYVVKFSEPIRLVTGFDVLDASIPASTYTVDAHNDRLDLLTFDCPSDPLATGLAAVGACLCSPSPSNAPVLAALTADSDADFVVLDPSASSSLPAPLPPPSASAPAPAFVLFLPVPGADDPPPLATTTAGVDAVCAAASSTSPPAYAFRVRKHSVHVRNGNLQITDLQQQLIAQVRATSTESAFTVGSTTSGAVSMQNYFELAHTRPFAVVASTSTIAGVLGFGQPVAGPTPPTSGSVVPAFWMPGGFDPALGVFASVPSASVTYTSRLVPPGMVNLLGVRYVTLRCPEIEAHLYSGMTFGAHSTGVGVFKLTPSNDVAQLRFDFVSVVRKPFHPIGKLTKLTLRFERDDGQLYDFKGVDNMLLVHVRFLTPTPTTTTQTEFRSVLNPDYDPDYLQYMTRQLADQANARGEGDGDDDVWDDGFGERGGDRGDRGDRRQLPPATARRILEEQNAYDYAYGSTVRRPPPPR